MRKIKLWPSVLTVLALIAFGIWQGMPLFNNQAQASTQIAASDYNFNCSASIDLRNFGTGAIISNIAQDGHGHLYAFIDNDYTEMTINKYDMATCKLISSNPVQDLLFSVGLSNGLHWNKFRVSTNGQYAYVGNFGPGGTCYVARFTIGSNDPPACVLSSTSKGSCTSLFGLGNGVGFALTDNDSQIMFGGYCQDASNDITILNRIDGSSNIVNGPSTTFNYVDDQNYSIVMGAGPGAIYIAPNNPNLIYFASCPITNWTDGQDASIDSFVCTYNRSTNKFTPIVMRSNANLDYDMSMKNPVNMTADNNGNIYIGTDVQINGGSSTCAIAKFASDGAWLGCIVPQFDGSGIGPNNSLTANYNSDSIVVSPDGRIICAVDNGGYGISDGDGNDKIKCWQAPAEPSTPPVVPGVPNTGRR
ncbi:hypothetical protein FWF48_02030 [Candidatus Saccharibacteria bacterium]|nr:hypothetical protein [Candidatus Saccharibacteria bacterium]